MSFILFDGQEVNYDLTQNPVLNLNEYVPDWFVDWLVKKQKEIIKDYYFDKNTFQIDFPSEFFYPDPDNPGLYKKPGAFGIRTRVDVTIPTNEGGDGQRHEITYYERAIHDEAAKDSRNGKRYTMPKGTMRIDLEARMYIPQEKVNMAVFLKYISPEINTFFVIIDEAKQIRLEQGLRKRYMKIMSMIDDGIEESKLRVIAGGEYRISNSDTKNLDNIKSELSTKIESAYRSNNYQADQEFMRFENCVRDFGDIAENKAFVTKCIDKKAVIKKFTQQGINIHINKGGEDDLMYGTLLFKLRDENLF
jgi:hypothetical protein